MTIELKSALLNLEEGEAVAGSQRQIQLAVNRNPEQLHKALETALDADLSLDWVSPLRQDRYREYWDGAFLRVLGLGKHGPALRDFWPSGGPHWDALARVNGSGVLLVEAKSYVNEMYAGGSDACGASLRHIEDSLARTKSWLGVDERVNWTGAVTQRGSLYQSANRLAHLYFFRQILGMDAWLVNLCFVNDLSIRTPTSRDQWQAGLAEAKKQLGLKSVPYAHDVLMDAVA